MQTMTYAMAAAYLSVLIHCLLKYKSLNTDAGKANITFSFKDYLITDWTGIFLSLLSPLLWLLMFGEWMNKYPQLEGFTVTSFATMGLFGSYILQLIFSRGKKKIRDVIDEKTNIADLLKKDN